MLMSAIMPKSHSRFGSPVSLGDPNAFLKLGPARGRFSDTGQMVTAEDSIGVSSVFASARNIAQDVAKLPLILYRRNADGGKDRASDLPLSDLLRLSPNPEMGSYMARSAILLSAATWGRGCAEIVRTGGRAAEIWPIEPWRVHPDRDSNGEVIYRVDQQGGKKTTVIARNMIHIRGISKDGVVGLMMLEHAGDAVALAVAAMRFTSRFFANGMSPGGVVELAGKLSPESLQAYADQFAEKYQGSNNTGKPLILDQGAKFNATTMSSEDGQRLETMRFAVEEVARYWRMPPSKLFDTTRAQGWSTLDQAELSYHTDTLLPWLIEVEQEFTLKLLNPEERKTLFVEHLHNALMRVDAAARSSFYNAGIQGGWLHRNEVRSLENMNPYPGGEKFLIQQNLATVGDDGMPVPVNKPDVPDDQADTDRNPPDDSSESAKLSMMPVFADVAARVIDREANAISRRKGDVAAWAIEWYAGHRDYVSAAFGPACVALGSMVGASNPASIQTAERFADAHVAESLRLLESCTDVATEVAQWKIERAPWMAQHLTDEVAK